MTTPDRTIGGLQARRRPDPKNLISANRQPPTATEPLAPASPPPADAGEKSPEAAAPQPPTTTPGPAPAASAAAEEPAQSAKDKMSVYVPSGLRKALRAAYRATSHLEGDDSFSAFVEKALQAELSRRESTYNQGQPFGTASGKLPSGRPLGN